MATTTTAVGPQICPQGHGPGTPGSRFCAFCGAPLVNGAAPGQPAAAGPPQGAAPYAMAGNATYSPTPTGMPGPPAAMPGTMPGASQGQWQPVSAGAPTAAMPGAMPPGMQPPMPPMPQGQWQPGQPAPPYPMAPAPAAAAPPVKICSKCRNIGAGLSDSELICPECGWLRPLLPGYALDRSVFLWGQDGLAMQKLQSVPALHSAVTTISDKVGRPWIESTFNAIRLGPRQLPDIYNHAVLAARILGLPSMPDVYVSGDQMWNTYTYGTETNFFIVLGTSHLINFSSDELLFVLAREMGHCRAGHALWKTVLRFIAGDTSVHGGLLSDGIIHAINLQRFVQGAIDMPLMAWARQSEITADRAGLMAIGDEALARRVLLAWSVRSARLLQMINIDEWMKQEDASGDAMTSISQLTTTSEMYTTRRLKLLRQSAQEANLMRWSASIQPIRKKLMPVPTQQMTGLGVGTMKAAKPAVTPRPAGAPAVAPRPAAPAGAAAPAGPGGPVYEAQPDVSAAASAGAQTKPGTAGPGAGPAAAPPADSIRVVCNKCQGAMRVPQAILRGKPFVNVRCPHCHNVLTLRPKAPAQPAPTQPVPGATPGAASAAATAGAGTKPGVPAPSPGSAAAKPDLAASGKEARPVVAARAAETRPAAPPPAHAGAKR
jgi:Zn-dependent protease with chaperone function